MKLCQGSFRLNFKNFLQMVVGTELAPQGTVMAPRLPELQERLDNALRQRVGILGVFAGPGIGLEFCGSLPAQDIMLF